MNCTKAVVNFNKFCLPSVVSVSVSFECASVSVAVFCISCRANKSKRGKFRGRRYEYKRKDTSKGAVIYLFARGVRGSGIGVQGVKQEQQWRANAE